MISLSHSRKSLHVVFLCFLAFLMNVYICSVCNNLQWFAQIIMRRPSSICFSSRALTVLNKAKNSLFLLLLFGVEEEFVRQLKILASVQFQSFIALIDEFVRRKKILTNCCLQISCYLSITHYWLSRKATHNFIALALD